jgi:hypothetical protein
MAQVRIIDKEYQLRINYEGRGLKKSDSFVFQVEDTGLKLFGLFRGVVLDVVIIPLSEYALLVEMFKQKVMRFELIQPDTSVVGLVALNQKVVSKQNMAV